MNEMLLKKIPELKEINGEVLYKKINVVQSSVKDERKGLLKKPTNKGFAVKRDL